MRRSGPLIVFPGVLALVACAGAPQEVHLPPASALATPIVVDPAFAAAPKILAGFELGSSAEDWQIGDQILIGIRVTKPGASTTRFLHVELMDRLNPLTVMSFNAAPAGRPAMQFESGLYYTRLSQYDEDAKLLDVAVGRFPEKLMGYGLFDGAAPAVGRKRLADGGMDFSSVTDAQAEHELFGWLSLFSFSTSMNKKGMFNEMMKDVVARPSLLAMLFNPSISLGMGREEELRLEPWSPTGAISVDGVTLPLTCSISGKLGAVARVHAARPVAPLSLAGGVVSVVGNNADNSEIRFEVRLLAAKRGDKGRAFVPTMEDPAP